jgi:hypothetical protein
MDTREAQAQATIGRPGCFDTGLSIGFVKSQDRSRLRCGAAAKSVLSQTLHQVVVAIFVSLGFLTAASANTRLDLS